MLKADNKTSQHEEVLVNTKPNKKIGNGKLDQVLTTTTLRKYKGGCIDR